MHTYTKPQTSNTRSRGLGWRIHGSVEDTKFSTNKQLSLSRSTPRPDGFHSSISAAQEGEGSCIQGQQSFVVNDRSALEYAKASPTPDAQRDADRIGDDSQKSS